MNFYVQNCCETNLYQFFCGLGRRVANDVNIDEYTLWLTCGYRENITSDDVWKIKKKVISNHFYF